MYKIICFFSILFLTIGKCVGQKKSLEPLLVKALDAYFDQIPKLDKKPSVIRMHKGKPQGDTLLYATIHFLNDRLDINEHTPNNIFFYQNIPVLFSNHEHLRTIHSLKEVEELRNKLDDYLIGNKKAYADRKKISPISGLNDKGEIETFRPDSTMNIVYTKGWSYMIKVDKQGKVFIRPY